MYLSDKIKYRNEKKHVLKILTNLPIMIKNISQMKRNIIHLEIRYCTITYLFLSENKMKILV